MKIIIVISFYLFLFAAESVMAVERKVDENGNEYFIVSGDELETTYKEPVETSKQAPAAVKAPEPSYRQIALQMKSGCAVAENIAEEGAAVISLEDFFVVIPTESNGLPPHPEENGKLSLHGVDSDNDCVRDDIEHYIFYKFSAENELNIRKYLFEYAVWLDFFLIQGISQESARTTDLEMTKVSSCLKTLLGFERALSEIQSLFSEFHNTFDRSHRYIDNLKQIGGWTQKGLQNVSCN